MSPDVFDLDEWENVPIGAALASLDERRRRLPRHGPGKTVAVVVIDIQNHFMQDGDPVSDAAVKANAKLLSAARAVNAPVFLVRVYHDTVEQLSHTWRLAEGLMGRDDPASQLHVGLGQAESDIVVIKRHASGFAGTSLHSQLQALGVDTLLLTGTSTSGCVRATAVDGSSLLYRVLVVEEGVYEPRRISGNVSLYELASRYADVISLDEAADVLKALA